MDDTQPNHFLGQSLGRKDRHDWKSSFHSSAYTLRATVIVDGMDISTPCIRYGVNGDAEKTWLSKGRTASHLFRHCTDLQTHMPLYSSHSLTWTWGNWSNNGPGNADHLRRKKMRKSCNQKGVEFNTDGTFMTVWRSPWNEINWGQIVGQLRWAPVKNLGSQKFTEIQRL